MKARLLAGAGAVSIAVGAGMIAFAVRFMLDDLAYVRAADRLERLGRQAREDRHRGGEIWQCDGLPDEEAW